MKQAERIGGLCVSDRNEEGKMFGFERCHLGDVWVDFHFLKVWECGTGKGAAKPPEGSGPHFSSLRDLGFLKEVWLHGLVHSQ